MNLKAVNLMRTESLIEKLKSYRILDYDFKLVIMLISLSVIGIMALGSADPESQDKQIYGLILGVFMPPFLRG